MNENIRQLIEEMTEELKTLFGIDAIAPVVHIVGSRAEMDKVKGHKTESWVVGTVKNDEIYLLDKERFESESDHPKSDFEKVLKHEIVHLYVRAVAGTKEPYWLNEGLACYLAGQVKSKPSSENIGLLREYYDRFDKSIYQVGYFWVNYLVDRFGIEKLIDFLYEWGKASQSPEEFERLFEKEFGLKI